jgi:hypothetical protein
MRIDNFGWVGIGTAFPGYNLDIHTNVAWGGARLLGTDNTQFIIESSNGFIAQYAFFQNNIPRFTHYLASTGDYLGIGHFDNAGQFIETPFSINRATGNVGIFNITPNARLTIGNNVATGFLDNYNEYQAILYDGGTAGSSYGLGIKPFYMVFNSNGGYSFDYQGTTSRMVIDPYGNVGIGTTTPAAKLEVTGSAILNNTLSDGARLVWLGGTGGTQEYRARVSTVGNLEFFPGELTPITLALTQTNRVGIGTAIPGGQFELSLDQGRKPGTNTWTVVSDKRLKRIVGNYQKGLKEILSLQPVEYYYINSETRKFDERVLNTKNVGFVAQDVQKIFPECVSEDDDGYLSLNIHAILIAFVNGFKEQQEQIKQQQAQIESLQKENAELKLNFLSEIEKLKKHINFEYTEKNTFSNK